MARLVTLAMTGMLALTATAPVLAKATTAELKAAEARGRREGERIGEQRERDRQYACEKDKAKGAKKGAIIGGAGAGAVSAIAGNGLGTTLLVGTAGAVAGNAVGKNHKNCR